jgi:hypothetical protein
MGKFLPPKKKGKFNEKTEGAKKTRAKSLI